MTVALTERFFLPTVLPAMWAPFGQTQYVAGTGGTPGFTLICYLTSPLPIDSRIDYVLMCHEDADDFIWTFSDGVSGLTLSTKRGDTVALTSVSADSTLKVEVQVMKGGKQIALLTMTQTVSEPSTKFQNLVFDLNSAGLGTPEHIFGLREICEDFKTYIESAASSTGPNGIPARLLAAVLLMEVWGRPKDGSPKAKTIRKSLEGEEYNPRLQALQEKAERFFGRKTYHLHLHDIRDVELELIRSFFNEIEDLSTYDPRRASIVYAARKTLGVGQIAQMTAAMTAGKTTWRDLVTGSVSATLDLIEADYCALSFTDLLGIFTALRFPKSNIVAAAQLLTKIKNRAHRFPAMSPRDVVTSKRAIEVIATEYNRGALDVPLASMKSNLNGDRAVAYVLNTPAKADKFGLSRFFPDPP